MRSRREAIYTEWITAVNKTIEIIERELENEIDVDKISREVFVSPFYLQNGFRILTSYPIGEYIRNRRLYEAAKRIVNTDESITDIAFRYGYDTLEGFTKAFSRFHGCSPAAVRKDRLNVKTFLPIKIRIEITGGDKMDFTIEKKKNFRIIGFERTFRSESAYKEIPDFWDEIMAMTDKEIKENTRIGKAAIENSLGEFGLCIDDSGSECFRYIIGGEYKGNDIPEEMTVFALPELEWARFRSVGKMPDSLQRLNTKIFKEWLPGNPDYEMTGYYNIEWYSQGDTSSDSYESEIWIPVKRK